MCCLSCSHLCRSLRDSSDRSERCSRSAQSLDGATTGYPLDAYTAWRRAGQLDFGQNAVRTTATPTPAAARAREWPTAAR
jgi:hypothetical protein